jgi:hypothetical protein
MHRHPRRDRLGIPKTLGHAAAGRSLVVFDDIQWGEETFRDLIEASRCCPRGGNPAAVSRAAGAD